jgi:hypothetical protein
MFFESVFPKSLFPGSAFPPAAAADEGGGGGGEPVVKSFVLVPDTIAASGGVALSAIGTNTTWSASNPFSIVSGPANALGNYVNIDGGHATFTMNITARPGTVVIHDSNSDTNFSITITPLGSPGTGSGPGGLLVNVGSMMTR